MHANEHDSVRVVGESLGYLVAYFLFTTILFFILTITGKHGSVHYVNVMFITAVIALAAAIVEKII